MRNKLYFVVMLGLIVSVSACASSGDKWEKDSANSSDNKESSWKKDSASTGGQTDSPDSAYWGRESRY
ncbi:hypothetical protein [Kaarinaea lacus]